MGIAGFSWLVGVCKINMRIESNSPRPRVAALKQYSTPIIATRRVRANLFTLSTARTQI